VIKETVGEKVLLYFCAILPFGFFFQRILLIHMQKRKRGVVLTAKGLEKFEKARYEFEFRENSGKRFTLEELSHRTNLDLLTIKKVLGGRKGVDKRTLEALFAAFHIHLCEGDYSTPDPNRRQDWGEAVSVSPFYGRTQELQTLQQWLLGDRCRLVTILGMGGVGKTCLSVRLAELIQDKFDCVVWRSLRDVLPIHTFLANIIQFLSDEQEIEAELPDSVSERISRLIDYLKEMRCLMVFDNVESVLQAGNRAGYYHPGCEGYGELFKRVGQSRHQSCLLLTTREKPKEIALSEGAALPVRTMRLIGFQEGEEIVKSKGLKGSPTEFKMLVDRYSGNALALKIVATTIQDLFDGRICEFLQQETTIFGSIRDLLDQQFERLSDLEKHLVYWLAINREPIPLSKLREDLVLVVPHLNLLEALESLGRRSLIEQQAACFTLQPIVMEYVTSRLIGRVCEEIISKEPMLLRSHALVKATAKEHIRETQIRLILHPIIHRLLSSFLGKSNLESHLTQILTTQREKSPLEPGYAAGNILNLFVHLGTSLIGYDLSRLTIWQADLRNTNLQNTNFAGANLAKCTFTETFGAVHAVALSPDAQLLAVGDSNGDIHLYCLSDMKHLLVCRGHTGWVTSLTFSADSKILASGSTDCTVKLWDVSTGQCLQILQGHTNEVWSVAFDQDSHLLASGSGDSTVKLWSVCIGQCLKTLTGHSGWVRSVAFALPQSTSSQPAYLFSGSNDHTVRLWDINTEECLQTLQGHCGGICSIELSPDGQLLASGSDDYTIKLWNIQTGECLKTIEGHQSRVTSVAFNSQGNLLASGGHDQTVKLWEVDTGKCFKTLQGHSSWVFSVAFSPQNNLLVSGGHDQTVKLWEVDTGQCLKTLQGYTNQIFSVAFSPDGQLLASGNRDRTIQLWDVLTGRCLNVLRGHSNWIQSVVFNPQGDTLASCSGDCTINLWDVRTAQLIRALKGHCAAVLAIAFSPDGQTLASGSEDHTVKLWDVRSGQLIRTLQGHCAAIESVVFLAEGEKLASGSWDQTIKLWDFPTGDCLNTLEGHTSWIRAMAASSDGSTLASASSDQTLRLWNVYTGGCLRVLQLETNWLQAIAFSPDDQMLASTYHDNIVKIWNIRTNECLSALQGHTGLVWSVAFSPDSQTLVSSGDDATIKLWDIETNKCLRSMRASMLYEQMNIAGVKGLTDATRTTLMSLGAIVDTTHKAYL
jgi:WD40 repeat protein